MEAGIRAGRIPIKWPASHVEGGAEGAPSTSTATAPRVLPSRAGAEQVASAFSSQAAVLD